MPWKSREQRHAYYVRNRDTILQKRAEYRETNRTDINKEHMRTSTALRLSLLTLLGNKCAKCGYTDVRALQIDHINGGGHTQRTKFGAQSMYRYFVNNPEIALKDLQILCANCNWIKRYENKEMAGWNRRQYSQIDQE